MSKLDLVLVAAVLVGCAVPVHDTSLGPRTGGQGGTGGTVTGGSAGASGAIVTGGTGGSTAGSAGAGGAIVTGGTGGVTGGTGGTPTGSCDFIGLSCDPSLDCNGESCCTSLRVTGGSFDRGDGADYPATVSDFCLDKFEITVGRMRAFLADYDRWISQDGGAHPAAGEGAHTTPAITGSGWDTTWTLPATAAEFASDSRLANCTESSWRDAPGAGENWPVNCLNWMEAFAFCIWDGGYLPTEAEWEYAAVGGSNEYLYPWGNDATAPLPANYDGTESSLFVAVGSHPTGLGGWGQVDLAGSLYEWVLDWYRDPYSIVPCHDCAYVSTGSYRSARGGGFLDDASGIQAAVRGNGTPGYRYGVYGARCARPIRESGVATDPDNCGAVGRACSTSGVDVRSCTGGVCTSSCAAGHANVSRPAGGADDGCEVDTNNDPHHCGAAGRACSATNVATPLCAAGLCVSTCDAGYWNVSHPQVPDADDGCEAAGTPTCAEGPSCGTSLTCHGESCCTSLPVPSGRVYRGDTASYPAMVSDFCLDKYEVTVGRFRAFLADYDTWISTLTTNAGAHLIPAIAGTGWLTSWPLPASAAEFQGSAFLLNSACNGDWTWRDTAGTGTPAGQEDWPINCISWYEAFAFCIWDGGYLPTEAEWEYAAAGGSEERIYPWWDSTLYPVPANYWDSDGTPFFAVGQYPAGNGRWGQSDLAGSQWEWVLDGENLTATPYLPVDCTNCAYLANGASRLIHGGSWYSYQQYLMAAYRYGYGPEERYGDMGVRCARALQ